MINRILVIDDDVEFSAQLYNRLNSNNYFVAVANSAQAALSSLVEKFDLVFCDAAMHDLDIKKFVVQLKEIQPEIKIIVTTNQINPFYIKDLLYCGVSDFVAKPFFMKEINGVIQNLKPVVPFRKVDSSNKGLINDCFAETSCIDWVDLTYNNSNPSTNNQINYEYLINHSSPIFITGEACTPKLNYAYKMHKESDRLNHPFVVFNCAQIMPDLMHKTLFGYEKGAFIGAFNTTPGVLEQAVYGTLVINGVEFLTNETQLALANAIKNNVFNRVGGAERFTTQIRIVANTIGDISVNNLKQILRPDFFQLFMDESISTTPLRFVKRDIIPVVNCMLQRINKLYGTGITALSSSVEQLFKSYYWSGNFAELYFVLRRAALLSNNDIINTTDIEANIIHSNKFEVNDTQNIPTSSSISLFTNVQHVADNKQLPNLKDVAVEAEIEAINQVLRNVKFNKTKAAKLLGIDRKTLYNKLLKNKKEEQSSN